MAAARIRVTLRRHRLGRLAVAALLGAAALVALLGAQAAADRAARKWAPHEPVVVVAAPVAAGAVVEPAAVVVEAVPRWLAPDDAVTELEPGRRAAVDLRPGEVLRAGRLTGAGSPTAARLPAGARGVALPAGDVAGLGVGDVVDLHAVATGRPVARAGLVVRLDEAGATVAVGERDVPGVLVAAATGGVVPVLSR